MSVLILTTAAIIILEPILIFGLGPIPPLGVTGSALAFILGIGAGLVMQFVFLLRGKMKICIPLADLRPDYELMRRIFRIALPSTIQSTLRSSSRLVIMALVGFYGTFATAGYGVANQLLTIAIIPCFGFGNAAGTMVGQNLGAKNPDRAARAAWWVSAYTAGYMVIVGTFLFACAQFLVPLFDPTPKVVIYASECIHIIVPSLVIYAMGIVLAVGLSGAGNTVPPMVINLITLWGIEVTLAYGLSRWLGMGVTGVWWGRAIANTVNGLLIAFWFYRGRWKYQKV
jgi:putative MATE family efflux protein